MLSTIKLVKKEVEPPTIRGLVIGAAVEPSMTSRLSIGIDVEPLMTME